MLAEYRSKALARLVVKTSGEYSPYHAKGPSIVANDLCILAHKDGNLHAPSHDSQKNLRAVQTHLGLGHKVRIELETHGGRGSRTLPAVLQRYSEQEGGNTRRARGE